VSPPLVSISAGSFFLPFSLISFVSALHSLADGCLLYFSCVRFAHSWTVSDHGVFGLRTASKNVGFDRQPCRPFCNSGDLCCEHICGLKLRNATVRTYFKKKKKMLHREPRPRTRVLVPRDNRATQPLLRLPAIAASEGPCPPFRGIAPRHRESSPTLSRHREADDVPDWGDACSTDGGCPLASVAEP